MTYEFDPVHELAVFDIAAIAELCKRTIEEFAEHEPGCMHEDDTCQCFDEAE
jgi:hypothetical protein